MGQQVVGVPIGVTARQAGVNALHADSLVQIAARPRPTGSIHDIHHDAAGVEQGQRFAVGAEGAAEDLIGGDVGHRVVGVAFEQEETIAGDGARQDDHG